MRVTIVLTTGAFLHDKPKGRDDIEVGYFETPFASDIEVFEDSSTAKSSFQKKLGNGNHTIEVEHLAKDGSLMKPVSPTISYEYDILKKNDLYDDDDAVIPTYNRTEYDCILHFNSGEFRSYDVRERKFTEHKLSDNSSTGTAAKETRPIANEIHVDYIVADGETLRLRGDKGDVWSSSLVTSGTKEVVVRLLTDDSLNESYHKKALDHKVQHYYLPNSDPPPMDGPRGGG
jgi:hypothetical protein